MIVFFFENFLQNHSALDVDDIHLPITRYQVSLSVSFVLAVASTVYVRVLEYALMHSAELSIQAGVDL